MNLEQILNEIISPIGLFGLIIILLLLVNVHQIKKNMQKTKSRGKKNGYVYIISNPSFKKDIYKIGMTERTVTIRIKELFTTGVPTPFHVEHKLAHKDPKKLEDYLHRKFAKYRINKRREFFEIPLKKLESELRFLDLL